MEDLTEVLHYKINDANICSSVTPIYQCSAFAAGSDYFYSRKNNPNVAEVESVVAKLEDAKYGIAYNCGMSAIYQVLDLISPNGCLVINKLLYGCSYKLFQRLSSRRGFNLIVTDLSDESNLEILPDNVEMVFFETPTNPFLKSIDISRVNYYTRRKNPNALIVVDNTWATSLYQKPLKHGADISLHSATKYLSGHSDVMGGVILVDNEKLRDILVADRFYAGAIITPYAAWLLRRSIQTLGVRLAYQSAVTKEIYEFIKHLPQVKQAYYPHIDGKQLVNYGGIIFFEFDEQYANRYEDFKKLLTLFETGTGMACVTSMVSQPYTGSHASMLETEKSEMGISKGLIRLCFGLEEVSKLKDDLLYAFNKISIEQTERV